MVNPRTCAFAIVFTFLAPTMNISASKASTAEENMRLVYYGMGSGMSLTLCELHMKGHISSTLGNIFASNFRKDFAKETANEEFSSTITQSFRDGFNAGVKEMGDCALRY